MGEGGDKKRGVVGSVGQAWSGDAGVGVEECGVGLGGVVGHRVEVGLQWGVAEWIRGVGSYSEG